MTASGVPWFVASTRVAQCSTPDAGIIGRRPATVKLLHPLPPRVARFLALAILAAWVVQMTVLVRSAFRDSTVLAADLARYGTGAQWKGVYYKGQKVGFMVGQTSPVDDGYELREEGELRMLLFGTTASTRLRTVVRVDRDFAVRSFSFSLDPGTGPIEIAGRLEGARLELDVKRASGTRHETRTLSEKPALSLNLPRQLAAAGLRPGLKRTVMAFDPATLRNAPMQVAIEAREVVWSAGRPVPAFRVRSEFEGVTSTSWVTDVGEVVKEESPMGLVVVRETRERATALAVPGDVRGDMLEAAAVVPSKQRRIDDRTRVDLLRVRLYGADLAGLDLQGAGQTLEGDVLEIRRPAADFPPGPADPGAQVFVRPETFIESDAPEILAAAQEAVRGVAGDRERGERLVRRVNAMLEKKPTVGLPSALEVLRTRVGDCNEHTALYVAMARALGIPARVAVGLVYVEGAFYYHAWPEIYLSEKADRGLWVAVDPTLGEFPADATHIRLARGGLDRQAAVMPLIGRLKLDMLDVQLQEGAVPILVGRATPDARPLALDLPRHDASGPNCWSRPR